MKKCIRKKLALSKSSWEIHNVLVYLLIKDLQSSTKITKEREKR
jgi:hypothetical protein